MKNFALINQRSGKKSTLLACGVGLLAAIAAHAQSLNISTVAGYAGKGSADGMGGGALFFNPQGVAVDGAGNVYVADSGNNTIRVITPAGISSTLAGLPGVSGSSDGTGANALFNQPSGIALDSATNIYVCDYGNSTIREITPSGQVTTIAGSAGVTGSLNATGTNAQFFQPLGIAVDSATNLYVADYGNHLIRKITPFHVVSTLAGSAGVFGFMNGTGTAAQFYEPEGVTVDSSGNVYVADTGNAAIRLITSGGVVSTFAGNPGYPGSTDGTGTNALFYQPAGIAINSLGNLYVVDYFNNTIREISSGGVVSTLAGLAGTAGSANGTNSSARFWGPQGVAVNSAGTVYIADTANSAIRLMTPAGVVTTLAGSPSVGSVNGFTLSARFYNPHNIAVDAWTNVYVADTQNGVIRKITPSGVVSILAGTSGVSGSTDGSANVALFSSPQGVAVDSAGNIYVADTGNSTIRKVTSGGVVSTLAGLAGLPGNADGTGTGAQFNQPEGLAVDSTGNVYVADTWNHTIRKITPSGITSTLAGLAGTFGSYDGANGNAQFNCPAGIAADPAGNLYVSDYNNNTIRKVTPAGVVSTLAGEAGVWGSVDGTNGNALFYAPAGISVDSLGDLYVVDSGNNTLRKVMPSGTNWVVSTVAGLPGVSGSFDGTGTGAEFYYPAGIAVDAAGYIYVADSGNNTVRFGSLSVLNIDYLTVTPTFDSAFISWSTPVDASTQVLYGPTASYGNLSALDSTPRTSHVVLLSDLTQNTTYYFEVVSTVGTNRFTASGTFTTAGPIIVQAPQASYSGIWVIATSPADKYSSYYKYASTTTGSGNAQATFQPTIPTPGYYDVYIWYSEGTNRSTNVPVLTSFQGGSVLTDVNQTLTGGQWKLLTAGQYFAAGANGFVRIGNGTGEANKAVIADAVEWVYSAGQDSPTNGTVPAWWANFFFGTNVVNGSASGANGYSLFANYVLGTSPVDPTSTLNFGIALQKPIIQATFSPWQAGNIYGLQSTASLVNPVWTNVPNLTVAQNTNGTGLITFTNTSGARAFYRLSVQMAP